MEFFKWDVDETFFLDSWLLDFMDNDNESFEFYMLEIELNSRIVFVFVCGYQPINEIRIVYKITKIA